MAEAKNLLEFIANQTPRVLGSIQAAGLAAANNSVAAENTATEVEKIYAQVAQDQSLVIRTQQLANQTVQQATQKAVAAAGGFDALYETISTLRTKQTQLRGELDTMRTEEIQAAGFSPLERIKLSLDWNGTRAKARSTVRDIQQEVVTATGIEGRINSVGTLARQSAESITAASIDASARIASAEYEIRARQARLEGIRHNTDQLNAVAGMEDKKLDVLIRAATADRAESQFQLALVEEGRRAAQFSWQKEHADAIRNEKLDEKAFEERTKYYVNLAEAARGLPLSDGPEWKDRLKLFKSGASKELEDLYLKGRIIHTTGVSLVGTSAADTARVLASSPGMNLPEERKKALALVTEAQAALAAARKTAGSPLVDDKDGTKAAGFINDYVAKSVAGHLKFVGNNYDNPFHIGELNSYIGTKENPGVLRFQQYPLVQRVLNPAIEGNISLSDPNVVFGLAQVAVNKGEISSSQAAADFTNIYRRANLLHRAAVGFNTLGITMPEGGAGYRTKIGGEVVDVTDFQAVARAMNMAMLRSAAQNRSMSPNTRKELSQQTDTAPFGVTEADRLRRQIRLQDRTTP